MATKNRFIVRDNVPILDEFQLKDDDGNLLVNFTPERLRKIAETNNQRIKDTGDMVPLVIGHTSDDAPEHKQPEIVGYAKDFRVGKFKKTNRLAVHAKFLFFKDKVNKARNYPRRSIELWLPDNRIDPISLLGATTPERDLGLVQLEKAGAVIHMAATGKKKVIRLFNDSNTPKGSNAMDEKNIVNAVIDALKQSSVWRWAEEQMRAQQPEDGEDVDGDDELPPDDEQPFDEDVPPSDDDVPPADNDEDDDDEDDVPPLRMSAASAPSGSNTHTPGCKKMSKKNTQSTSLIRFQKAINQARRENEELRLKFQRSERERDLMELAAQGYEFDPSEELDYAMQLPEDHYQYHLKRIASRYQRAPIGPMRFDLSASRSHNPRHKSDGNSRERMNEVVSYATKKGISYEQALAELAGQDVN